MSFPKTWMNGNVAEGDVLIASLDEVVEINRQGTNSSAVNLSNCKHFSSTGNRKTCDDKLTWWANNRIHQKWASQLGSGLVRIRFNGKNPNTGFERFDLDYAVNYHCESLGQTPIWRGIGSDPFRSLKWADHYEISGVIEGFQEKGGANYVYIRALTLDKQPCNTRWMSPRISVDFSLINLEPHREDLLLNDYIRIRKIPKTDRALSFEFSKPESGSLVGSINRKGMVEATETLEDAEESDTYSEELPVSEPNPSVLPSLRSKTELYPEGFEKSRTTEDYFIAGNTQSPLEDSGEEEELPSVKFTFDTKVLLKSLERNYVLSGSISSPSQTDFYGLVSGMNSEALSEHISDLRALICRKRKFVAERVEQGKRFSADEVTPESVTQLYKTNVGKLEDRLHEARYLQRQEEKRKYKAKQLEFFNQKRSEGPYVPEATFEEWFALCFPEEQY